MNLTCDVCHRSGFSTKASLSSHKSKFHRGENVLHNQKRYDPKEMNVQTSMEPDLKMNAKTSNEIVNDHLDNYRHLYDDETFNRLKRKASSKDETPYTYSKDNLPSDEVSAPIAHLPALLNHISASMLEEDLISSQVLLLCKTSPCIWRNTIQNAMIVVNSFLLRESLKNIKTHVVHGIHVQFVEPPFKPKRCLMNTIRHILSVQDVGVSS